MSEPTKEIKGGPLDGWHLDKRFPIVMLLGMLLQFVGVVFMFGQTFSTVDAHERRISTLESQQDDITELRVNMARIETLAQTILARLDRQEEQENRQ